jgi:hypothetical protein
MNDLNQNPLPKNTSFSEKLPALQISIDSTSLGAFKTCPEYYNLAIRLGYVLDSIYENADLKWGLEFHAAMELFDRLKSQNIDTKTALIETIKHTLIRTWDKETSQPWISENPNKTRFTLIRAVIWYVEQFKNDPLETIILANGKPAVELSFRFESGIYSMSTEEQFMLCGHIDRLIKFHNQIFVTDKKTTKYQLDDNFFDHFNPDNQMSLYDLAGSVVFNQQIEGIIIDGIQCQVNGNKFRRGFIYPGINREVWLNHLKFWLRQLELTALEEQQNPNYPWPKNDKNCIRYGRPCEFAKVCRENLSMRQKILNTHYKRRVWDPLITREV